MEASLATFCTRRGGQDRGRRRRWARFSPPFNSSILYENVRGSEQGALFHPLRPFINRHPLYSTHNALHCSSRPRAHGCGSVQNLGQRKQESRCPRTLVCIIYAGWHERNASIFIRQLHGGCCWHKERVRENAFKKRFFRGYFEAHYVQQQHKNLSCFSWVSYTLKTDRVLQPNGGHRAQQNQQS